MSAAVRCIDCGRPVRALGGAWCETHRPLDLTGGVMPWDSPTRVGRRGFAPTVRAVYGEVPRMLEAAGWERVERGARSYWRDPSNGEVVTQETARDRHGKLRVSSRRSVGRPRATDYAGAARWVERIEAGERYAVVATDAGVSVDTVRAHVARLRAQGAA